MNSDSDTDRRIRTRTWTLKNDKGRNTARTVMSTLFIVALVRQTSIKSKYVINQSQPRGYYGTVRNYCTVRLDFGKKYDTKFLETVRYGKTVLYFPYLTVHFSYSSNARLALLLHFSFLPMALRLQLRSPLTLTTSHPSQFGVTIL